ncbi:MAG: hypothetical protein R3324_10385 [Halobacteriales archaeon]|nr:hypothetical protein [Halobacteriales archaeon]
MKMRGPVLATLTALVLGLTGCASGGSQAPGDADRDPMQLVVDHRNSTASSITVYVTHTDPDQRTRLGTVRLGEQKTFTHQNFITVARYRFIARETGGTEWSSESFLVTPGDVAVWDTDREIVWVGEEAGGSG